MDVLDEGFAERVGVVGVAQHDRDGGQAGRLGCPQPPLPRDQLVARPGPAHHDRLQDAHLADRGRERVDRLVIEVRPGLLRVGGDRVDRDLEESTAVAPLRPRARRGSARKVPGPGHLASTSFASLAEQPPTALRAVVLVVQRRPDRGRPRSSAPPPGASGHCPRPAWRPSQIGVLVDHDDPSVRAGARCEASARGAGRAAARARRLLQIARRLSRAARARAPAPAAVGLRCLGCRVWRLGSRLGLGRSPRLEARRRRLGLGAEACVFGSARLGRRLSSTFGTVRMAISSSSAPRDRHGRRGSSSTMAAASRRPGDRRSPASAHRAAAAAPPPRASSR